VLGGNTRVDILAYFLRHKIEEARLMDVEPIKLVPTWRNNRYKEARVSKCLDRFLI
jgi:hypothetical protein